jgi:hypothetical protein
MRAFSKRNFSALPILFLIACSGEDKNISESLFFDPNESHDCGDIELSKQFNERVRYPYPYPQYDYSVAAELFFVTQRNIFDLDHPSGELRGVIMPKREEYRSSCEALYHTFNDTGYSTWQVSDGNSYDLLQGEAFHFAPFVDLTFSLDDINSLKEWHEAGKPEIGTASVYSATLNLTKVKVEESKLHWYANPELESISSFNLICESKVRVNLNTTLGQNPTPIDFDHSFCEFRSDSERFECLAFFVEDDNLNECVFNIENWTVTDKWGYLHSYDLAGKITKGPSESLEFLIKNIKVHIIENF